MNHRDRRLSRCLFGLLAVVSLVSAACSDDSGPTTEGPTSTTTPASTTTTAGFIVEPMVPVPVYVDENGFDDHTVPEIASVDEYFALARQTATRAVTKFSIFDMFGEAEVRWSDSNFYELHDQWYWFRLLNGQRIPAASVRPVSGLEFATIGDINEWAERQAQLPLDLEWVDGQVLGAQRLYSPRFYEIVLDDEPRRHGVGSLVYFPPTDANPERWLLELEFGDDASPSEIATFFDRLVPTLPKEIGDALTWAIRSPVQEKTARAMEADQLPYHDRIVRFSEIVEPGEVSVYNNGIAAGRLLLVDAEGSQLARATSTDILVMEHVPDYLPPGSALITSDPQTPLAHVNLLARNRGIPNASLAGAVDHPGVRQAAEVRAPVIVRAEGDSLEITVISRDEYREWLARLDTPRVRVPAVDLTTMPLTVDLSRLATSIGTDDDLVAWRPVIGGKSAGFISLINAGAPLPPTPLAVTVRPYLDHLESLDTTLTAMLRDDDFTSDPRARFLFLEGPSDFASFYSAERDIEFGFEVSARNPPGTVLGDVLAAEGFKKVFRDQPMNPDTLSALTETLEATFGDYTATQGLRFRSSSSVEDIEGFNGAGLYDSNTGFLDPLAQPDDSDHKKTIEYTIKKTWASYWGFEAFEERIGENVDHRSGAMGVLVHARFDDELELNNGVATFTFLPDNATDLARVVINTQAGAVSVTNPDPGSADLPEVVEVTVTTSGSLRIERLQESTITNSVVLDDEAVRELVGELRATTTVWRDQVNGSLPGPQQVDVVTLDFEFKRMAQGWPATDGDAREERLILKQARSLDPGLRRVPSGVVGLDIPRDLLARARVIAEYRCGAETVIAVWTDPLASPDMGHATSPFLLPETDTELGECTRRTLHSTADQYLLELLDTGERLRLTN